jgi:hypothetical protein
LSPPCQIANYVHQSNSTIIGNTSQWLLHGILDYAIDRFMRVVDVYQERTRWHQVCDVGHLTGRLAAEGRGTIMEHLVTGCRAEFGG